MHKYNILGESNNLLTDDSINSNINKTVANSIKEFTDELTSGSIAVKHAKASDTSLLADTAKSAYTANTATTAQCDSDGVNIAHNYIKISDQATTKLAGIVRISTNITSESSDATVPTSAAVNTAITSVNDRIDQINQQGVSSATTERQGIAKLASSITENETDTIVTPNLVNALATVMNKNIATNTADIAKNKILFNDSLVSLKTELTNAMEQPTNIEESLLLLLQQVDRNYDGVDVTYNETSESIKTKIKQYLNAIIRAYGIPAGSIIPFCGDTVPQHYLLCNGSAISRETYANLFDAIGTIYGVGDGETTFNLPDLRDRFVEGVGTNALGTYLEAGLPNIMGYFTTRALATTGVYYKGFYGVTSSATDKYVELNGDTNLVDVYFNANRANSIYSDSVTTVQPKSLNLNYIIKV